MAETQKALMGLIIRKATPDDSAALIEHANRIVEEAGHLIGREIGEFALTERQHRQMLVETATVANSVFLVAEMDGALIGVLDCRGGKRKANQHTTTLGISVRRAWYRCGVGTGLMASAIQWAKASEVVKRIELYVHADNASAIRLYQRFGFIEEGRRRRAVLRGREYVDELIMSLLL